MCRTCLLLVVIGLSSLLGVRASAQPPAEIPGAIVPLLVGPGTTERDRISSLEAQVEELRQSLRTAGSAVPAPAPIAKPRYPNIQLNGLLHIDGGFVEQDDGNRLQLGDIDNSLGFRRARIGVDGFITEHLYFRLVPDFALGGRPSFRDAYIEYRDLDIGTIRLGEFRQPFGMDVQTPASDQLFLERSLVNALSPFRQTGLSIRNHNADETVTWHASVFGFPTDHFANAIGDSGLGVVGRVTALPWVSASGKSLIHVGADYGYEHPGDEGLRYRAAPEYGGLLTGPSGNEGVVPPFVDTGVLLDATSNLFNLEFAAIAGPFSVQAEAACALIDLQDGDSATVSGAYVQAIYVLTSETHDYHRESASLSRLVPHDPVTSGGIGAWELAGRLSTLDLNDGPIAGGRVHNVTLGVNWYLNKHSRLQFDAIRSFLDREPVGKSQSSIFASRLAVDF